MISLLLHNQGPLVYHITLTLSYFIRCVICQKLHSELEEAEHLQLLDEEALARVRGQAQLTGEQVEALSQKFDGFIGVLILHYIDDEVEQERL